MGRCRAVGLTALLCVSPLLAACSEDAAKHASTDTDVTRAQKVWADPWVAPEDLAVPTSAYGSNGFVVRLAGRRESAYAGGPPTVARLETQAALEHGWELYAATCKPRTVSVQVVRGDELDDAALTTITATRGSPNASFSRVEVTAVVPHHADGSWPVSDERVALADTCLGTGKSTDLVQLPGPPTEGDGEEGDPDFEGWRRDTLSDDEEGLLEDVAADPWVQRVGASISSPSMRDGDSRRFGSFASGTLPATAEEPRAAVAAVVAEMDAWEPTWASCVPTSAGSVDVRLRLVTEHGVATARVRQDPSLDGQVAWSIAVPVPEAPVPDHVTDAPALADPACLGADRLPTSLTIEGEPVAVPYRLQPVPD